jgi:DNA-binding beta-propeller fold protein YncE
MASTRQWVGGCGLLVSCAEGEVRRRADPRVWVRLAVGFCTVLFAGAALAQPYVYSSQFEVFATGGEVVLEAGAVVVDPTTRNIVVLVDVISGLGSRPPVQIFNSAGVFQSQFGTIGNDAANGQFLGPAGMAIDPVSHNIVVTDAIYNRVQIFDSSGNYLGQFGSRGTGNGQFDEPFGVAIDPASGDIVVADHFNNRVQIFDSSGNYLSQFGSQGTGNGQFEGPLGVAIDPATRNIAVVENGFNSRVQIFTAAGVYVSQFGSFGSGNGQFDQPSDLQFDPTNSNIVVADRFNNRVQIFGQTGKKKKKKKKGSGAYSYLTQFGSAGTGNGQFVPPDGGPGGVAVDPTTGNIIVTDTDSGRIQIFAP